MKLVRKQIAAEKGVPAYIIFHDSALKDMATKKPLTELEMLEVQGMGEAKFRTYGEIFLKTVSDFLNQEQTPKKSKPKKEGTHDQTLSLFMQGLSISEIALHKNIAESTVISHLIKLKTDGKPIDLSHLITAQEIELVKNIVSTLKEPTGLKPIYEALNGELDYDKIKLALTY